MQAIYAAEGGLQKAENQLDRTVSLLARSPFSIGAPQDEVSLSDAAISLLEAKAAYTANLDTVKVTSSMEKSTLSLLG